MTWEAAMRWARLRARDTGERHRVFAYAVSGVPMGGKWRYAVGKADPWAGCWPGCE